MSKDIPKKVTDITESLLYEVFKNCDFQKDVDEFKSISTENITFSRRHKIRMNRIFRERFGSSNLPYPEVDNLFERIRSKIVITHNSYKGK